jgi:hypothetical protein
MPTQAASPAAAPAAVIGTSPKLLQLLHMRLRQLVRITLGLAIGLALAATALALWWLTSPNGLPDIGDPFDVAAFRARRIPDDQNAFTWIRRAAEKLIPWPDLPLTVLRSAPTVSWSKADPKLRAWVEENCQALELFQKGAEQSDASLDLAGDPLTSFDNSAVNPGDLGVLALLEGSRRQESGDTAGAWDCYRAVLRATAHVSRRENLQQARVNAACRWLGQRLATWATDPRTTIPQLRRALDEVLKAEPKPEWDSYTLKVRYLETMRSLDRPMDPYQRREIEGEWTYRLGDMQVSADIIESIEAARRFLLREPERSRRVVRLLYAHWLAHVETRELQPPKPAVRAQLTAPNPASVALYPVSPGAPAGARALPPQELASWLVTAHDAKLLILWANSHGDPWPPNHLYRRAHRALVIMLATEIYRRERGALPPSEEALVGTYFKSLPDDGSAGLGDEMTPTVE